MKEPAARSQHHYALAHVALRKFCEGNPFMFFAVIASPNRDALLQDIWQQVCDMCAESGKPDFNIGDVGIETLRLKDYPAILVTFPKPAKVPEAHFAVVVLKVNLDEQVPDENSAFLYFTLEHGMTLDGSAAYTVLGEWCGDCHGNLGEGPEPTAAAFLASVEARL